MQIPDYMIPAIKDALLTASAWADERDDDESKEMYKAVRVFIEAQQTEPHLDIQSRNW
jgi:hypothetical protein